MTLSIDVQLSLPAMFISYHHHHMLIGLTSTVCAANRPTIVLTTSHYYDMAATKHSATHDSDGI